MRGPFPPRRRGEIGIARFFDSEGREIPSPGGPVGELAPVFSEPGAFDDASVVLTLRSQDLDPGRVTKALDLDPDRSWKAGELHSWGRSELGLQRSVDWGIWLRRWKLQPEKVAEDLAEFCQALPPDAEVWDELSQSYTVRLVLEISSSFWNTELTIPAAFIQWCGDRGLDLTVDVFTTQQESEE